MKNSTVTTLDWEVVKEKLLQQFSTLTEEDLMTESGKEDEVFDKLEAKLGMPKEEIYDMVGKFEK